ncbi:hypothetical protein P4O66_004907, partial [Electrophorus voltai]
FFFASLFVGYCCYDCNMTNAHFESQNFYTVLRWEAVAIPGEEVRYRVQYNKYGEASRPMAGCQNISIPFCNLTSVMTDVRSRYSAKIMVNEKCGQNVVFTPSEQTILGAPKLSTSVAGSTVTVRATAPMGPQNLSIDKIICWEKCQGSDEAPINYIVRLTHPETEVERQQPFENKSGTVTLHHLELGKEYCGIVLYQLTHPAVNRHSENATFCVTLPAVGKPWMQVLFMSGLVALVFLATPALVLCQLYVTRKRRVPAALIMSKNNTVPYYPDPQVVIADVKICSEFIKNTDKFEPQSHPVLHRRSNPVSNESGYAVQDHHSQIWQSYTNPQSTSVGTCDQNTTSSNSYSMVVSISVPGPEDPSQFAKDGCVGDSIMSGTSGQVCATEDRDSFQVLCNPELEHEMGMVESRCDLLMLPVLRDSNENLKFSSIFFQPVSSSDLAHSSENTPPVTDLTPAGERCPLLTELVTMDESEWLGSELGLNCRRAYLPNGAPQSCSVFCSTETAPLALFSDSVSNYRKNWVPGISPETQLNKRDCTMRTVQLHALAEQQEEEAEEEEKETQSRFGSIALGGWMLQIQG